MDYPVYYWADYSVEELIAEEEFGGGREALRTRVIRYHGGSRRLRVKPVRTQQLLTRDVLDGLFGEEVASRFAIEIPSDEVENRNMDDK